MIKIDEIENGKSDKYNRRALCDNNEMQKHKLDVFSDNNIIVDKDGKELHLHAKNAKAQYHSQAQEHIAHCDHVLPLQQGYQKNKYNYYVDDKALRDILNSPENLQIIDGKLNMSKGKLTNEDYVKKHPNLPTKTKDQMIADGKKANKSFQKKIAIKTGEKVGQIATEAIKDNVKSTAAYVGTRKLIDVAVGNQEFEDALQDTVCITVASSVKSACTDIAQVGVLGVGKKVQDVTGNKILTNVAKSDYFGPQAEMLIDVGVLTYQLLDGQIDMGDYADALVEKSINLAISYQVSLMSSTVAGPAGIAVAAAGIAISLVADKILDSIAEYCEKQNQRQFRIENYRIIANMARAEGEKVEKILDSANHKYKNEISDIVEKMKCAVDHMDDQELKKERGRLSEKYEIKPLINCNTEEEMRRFFTSKEVVVLGDMENK